MATTTRAAVLSAHQEILDAMPDDLSLALAMLELEDGWASGAQRMVFFADEFVLKFDPTGSSTTNEIAWYQCSPRSVAPTKRIDCDVPEFIAMGGIWSVMQRGIVEGMYDSEQWYAEQLDDVCLDDLHSENVATMPDGSIRMIDMGCCHPGTGEHGDFWISDGQGFRRLRRLVEAYLKEG